MANPTDSIPKLTDDIIIEILSRLPVKILCKFRCVSKSWNSLIVTQHFCKTHLRNSKRYSDFTQNRILLNYQRSLKHCSLYSLLYDSTIDPIEIDYLVHFSGKTVWVVGCVDGLFCVAVSTGLVLEAKDLYLWNPATRKYNRLPDFGEEITSHTYFAYGLCSDKSADDYNVVGFCNSSDFRDSNPEAVVKVYSIKTGEWKRIKNYKGPCLLDCSAIFVNGKFHWIAYKDESWKVEHLDLKTEEYGILKMPKVEESGLYLNLGTSEGCLYFLCSHETHADVWIMA